MPGLTELVRLRPVVCADLVELLPMVAAGEGRVDRRSRSHMEQCLRCQAEIARYRRMLRALRGLRNQAVTPAPGVLGEVLDAIAGVGSPAADRAVRAAYLAGITVATAAAGALGLAVWVAHRRPGSSIS